MLHAQDPMSKETKAMYTAVKGYILKSAEKMPEANYSFKPSPEVRNYGAILGHLADDQYFFCSAAKGEKKDTSIEKEVTTKAALDRRGIDGSIRVLRFGVRFTHRRQAAPK